MELLNAVEMGFRFTVYFWLCMALAKYTTSAGL